MKNTARALSVLSVVAVLAGCGNTEPLSVKTRDSALMPFTNNGINLVVVTMDVKNTSKDPVRITAVNATDQNGAMLNSAWSAVQREMGGVPAELITHDWVLEGPGAGLPDARQIRAQMEQQTGFGWGTPLQRATIVRQEGLFRSDVSVRPMERILSAGAELSPASYVVVIAGSPAEVSLDINYEHQGKAKARNVAFKLN